MSQAVTGVTQLPGQDTLDPEAADILATWAEAYQLPDEMSMWDDGDYYSSRRDLATAYEPPTSNLPGLGSAVGLLAAWACLFKHAIWGFDLFGPLTPWHVLDGVLTFAALEFVSTGLFITTHDSMHGSVTPNNRFLNDVIGATCISLYAWFDYSLMWTKHWEHHNLCGTPNEDPDFHKGDPGLLPWFFHFMKGYISWQQFVKLQGTVFFLGFFGAPIQNMLLFWAGSGLLSAVRLFYYGTFIPHKPRKGADEVMAWAKARSASGPTLVSFLRCYNFDMHWEHHRWPFCPWWDLPRARKIRYQAMGSIDD
jgi:beta-carotene ketolase (CrtW type)